MSFPMVGWNLAVSSLGCWQV